MQKLQETLPQPLVRNEMHACQVCRKAECKHPVFGVTANFLKWLCTCSNCGYHHWADAWFCIECGYAPGYDAFLDLDTLNLDENGHGDEAYEREFREYHSHLQEEQAMQP